MELLATLFELTIQAPNLIEHGTFLFFQFHRIDLQKHADDFLWSFLDGVHSVCLIVKLCNLPFLLHEEVDETAKYRYF